MTVDIYAFVLSIVLGVLTLSFTIDMSLLPAFVASGFLSALLYFKSSKTVKKRYQADQQTKTELNSHLLKSWDNVLLNNSIVQKNFNFLYDHKLLSAKDFGLASATAAGTMIFMLSFVAGLPVAASILWILLKSPDGTGEQFLVALLATLPRQLGLLSIFKSVFQSLTGLLSLKAKFEVLCAGTSLAVRDLKSQIQLEQIYLNQSPIKCIDSLVRQLSCNPKGRHEIRGANGAGKSTLLLQLNHQLKSSLYLPTLPDLLMDTGAQIAKSSGENLMAHLTPLLKSEVEVILLDEWDANLDESNLIKMEDLVTKLSEFKTVLEIRHR